MSASMTNATLAQFLSRRSGACTTTVNKPTPTVADLLRSIVAHTPAQSINATFTGLQSSRSVPTNAEWQMMSPVLSAYAALISAVRDAQVVDPISDTDSSFSEASLSTMHTCSCGSDSGSVGIPECDLPIDLDVAVDVAEVALREEDATTVKSEGHASSSNSSAPAPSQCEEDCVMVFPATGSRISPNNALLTTRAALLQSHSTTPSNGSISPCGHFKRNRVSNQRKTRQCVCGHCNMQWVEVNMKRLNKVQQKAVRDLTTVVPFDAALLPSEVVRDIGLAGTPAQPIHFPTNSTTVNSMMINNNNKSKLPRTFAPTSTRSVRPVYAAPQLPTSVPSLRK